MKLHAKKVLSVLCAAAVAFSFTVIIPPPTIYADEAPANLALTATASSNIADNDKDVGRIAYINDGNTGTKWQFGTTDKTSDNSNYDVEKHGEHNVTLTWETSQTIQSIIIKGEKDALSAYDGTTTGGYYFTYVDEEGQSQTVSGGLVSEDKVDPATRMVQFDEAIVAQSITLVAVKAGYAYYPKYSEVEVYAGKVFKADTITASRHNGIRYEQCAFDGNINSFWQFAMAGSYIIDDWIKAEYDAPKTIRYISVNFNEINATEDGIVLALYADDETEPFAVRTIYKDGYTANDEIILYVDTIGKELSSVKMTMSGTSDKNDGYGNGIGLSVSLINIDECNDDDNDCKFDVYPACAAYYISDNESTTDYLFLFTILNYNNDNIKIKVNYTVKRADGKFYNAEGYIQNAYASVSVTTTGDPEVTSEDGYYIAPVLLQNIPAASRVLEVAVFYTTEVPEA